MGVAARARPAPQFPIVFPVSPCNNNSLLLQRRFESILSNRWERIVTMRLMRLLRYAGCAFMILGFGRHVAVSASEEVTMKAKKFVEAHTAKLRPLEIASALAWWNANVSGKQEDFQEKVDAQNKVDEALANPQAFKEVQELKKAVKEIDDPVTARCIGVLYLTYLEKQVDTDLLKKMVQVSNKAEKAFNQIRDEVEGKKVTDKIVREKTEKSKDWNERQKYWEASKPG